MSESPSRIEGMVLPDTICVVSWNPKSDDRRVAVARLDGQRRGYEFRELSAINGTCSDLLQKLATDFGSRTASFIGINLPIGVPIAYAAAAGIRSFREALSWFGKELGWQNFYVPTDKPEVRQPFYPSTLGLTFQKTVMLRALGLTEDVELFRRCERKTAKRYQGRCVFDLTFTAESGRSAATGWQELLAPLSQGSRLWPFDGRLGELIAQPGFTAGEIYPEEAAAQLGLPFGPGGRRNKRNNKDRSAVGPMLLEISDSLGICLSTEIRTAVLSGFASHHDFDAFVALVAVIRVIQGMALSDLPDNPDLQKVEGWILGQSHAAYQPAEAPRAFVQERVKKTTRFVPFFVKAIVWGPRGNCKKIEPAYPLESGRGAINIVCGLNNSGKSFLLEQLYRVMKRKTNRGVIRVEPRTTRQPRILFFPRTWEDKEKVGSVNLDQTAESLSVRGQHGDYLRSGLSFLASQMAPYLDGVSPEEAPHRVGQTAVREQIQKVFKIQTPIYKCNGQDPLIQTLESILEGHLYFRCLKKDSKSRAWNFEFILYYADGTTLSFDNWSDGARAIFYVLVCLKYFQPEIVLFDEIENHLHPAFMSYILEVLSRTPAQTIVATHHPHLIFSRFADRVFYLETKRPELLGSAPRQVPFSSEFREFERRVLTLEDSFEKISSAYRLFKYQDDQLLRQAGYVERKATLALVEVLSSIFIYPPVAESTSPLADSQTQQLAERIRAFTKAGTSKSVTVLDLGAGIGRQVAELAKLSEWQLRTKVRWTCFEPVEANRTKLMKRFGNSGRVAVVGDSSQLGAARFDFCVLANVLHELTPPEFVRYLMLADAHTRHDTGGVIILELSPLLHAEGHAVPYEAVTLRKILRDAGYASESAQIPVRQGSVSAYCLLARRQAGALNEQQVVNAVEKAWKEILSDCLSSYAMKLTPSDLEGYQNLASRLTTIASIVSWNEGTWKANWQEAR